MPSSCSKSIPRDTLSFSACFLRFYTMDDILSISNFRASLLTNHVTLTWRNLTDSDSSNPCLSSSLLFKASPIFLCFPEKIQREKKRRHC
ncbi:hypothetical protein YC2023_039842 [Brassica napus]